jgi:hypothetical protein
VELSLDWKKDAKGPENRLPPAGKCGYVSRFVRIVKVHGLKPSDRQLQRCKQQLTDYCGQKQARSLAGLILSTH